MPFIIKFNGGAATQQSQIIPDATPNNAGVMTPAQAAAIEGAGPSPFEITTSVVYQGTNNPRVAGSLGFTRDGAYIGGIRLAATANNGKDYAIGVLGFLALRQGGVVTQFDSSLQGQPIIVPGNGNGDGIVGIASPGFKNLKISIALQINGGDVDYIVQGIANFRFDAYWAQSPSQV